MHTVYSGKGACLETRVAEWFYIGHYGQLGPLTRDQIGELIEGGVIARETFVWKSGMTDWLSADKIPELASNFSMADPFVAPPPPPSPARVQPPVTPRPFPTNPTSTGMVYSGQQLPYGSGLRSDKSRTLAGVLNLFIPGGGRLYLGYSAIGALQMVVTIMSCGLLWLWPVIDGIIILAGGVKLDGYGRQLAD